MLSYQHIYHAGNSADVHKHSALYTLLEHMRSKGKAMSYLETHAGRGLYPLASAEMQKTGEFNQGAGALLREPERWQQTALGPWLNWLQGYYRQDRYPGSPVVARDLLPPPNVLHLMELHPQEFTHLQALKAPNIHLHKRDGREGLPALSPPEPRRGLALIDPSWEEKDDYRRIPRQVEKTLQRWPNGVLMIWYPLLASARHRELIQAITLLGRPCLQQQWTWSEAPEKHGMYGSGLLLINPPWGVDDLWQNLLNTLTQWKETSESQQQWLVEPE